MGDGRGEGGEAGFARVEGFAWRALNSASIMGSIEVKSAFEAMGWRATQSAMARSAARETSVLMNA